MCNVCMTEGDNFTQLCAYEHEDNCCVDCYKGDIECRINDFNPGACPPIYCSLNHKNITTSHKKRIIPYNKWKNIVSSDVVTTHSKRYLSVLAFLCGGCHSLKNLNIQISDSDYNSVSKKSTEELTEILASNGKQHTVDELNHELDRFATGDLQVDELLNNIVNVYFPPQMIGVDEKKSWDLMLKILKIIPDPERRVCLQLKYYNQYPRFFTHCCGREHCFRCKTKDWHKGKSCDENSAALDHGIVVCPNCSLHLSKGDGCNTVTCVCGRQFSWSSELQSTQHSLQFIERFPINTLQECIKLLTTSGHANDVIVLAKAWQGRNNNLFTQELLRWWIKSYPNCPSQASLLYKEKLASQPDGIQQAVNLWCSKYSQDVDKCQHEKYISINSIFASLYNEQERPSAAVMILGGGGLFKPKELFNSIGPLLRDSVRNWVNDNKSTFDAEVVKMEYRSASAFLDPLLYGNKVPTRTNISNSKFEYPFEWCSRSNSSLTFDESRTSAKRVGAVSCYPAAIALLPSTRSMITAQLTEAPMKTNWVTFGLAHKDFRESSSDGIGRDRNTWGISDDRAASGNSGDCHVSGTDCDETTMRKLKEGDILQMFVDTREGWCEFQLNYGEVTHRFNIPSSDDKDAYVFAATLASDTQITILNEIKCEDSGHDSLNPSHTEMYNCLRSYIRRTLKPDSASSMKDTIEANAKKWVTHCFSRNEPANPEAVAGYITSFVTSIVDGVKLDSDELSRMDGYMHEYKITWQMLYNGVCWNAMNRTMLEKKQQINDSTLFIAEHGLDTAPFMAACLLADCNRATSTTVQKRIALAYMRLNPIPMHDWYDYNASLSEPMLGLDRADRDCCCLPRHQSRCPNRNSKQAEVRRHNRRVLAEMLQTRLEDLVSTVPPPPPPTNDDSNN